MSFWSKLGKIGLKVAPIAAMAIPGIGPLASMAIQGGISAAQKKAAGGSWKDALLSGGIGAGASYLGGKLPGIDKAIGPSASMKDKILGNLGQLGKDTLANIGNRAMTGQSDAMLGNDLPSQGGITGNLPRGSDMSVGQPNGNLPSRPIGPTSAVANPNAPVAPSATIASNQPKDFGPGVFGEYGEFADFPTRNPNIAGALSRGQSQARNEFKPPMRGRGRMRRPGIGPRMQPMMAQ